MITSLSDQNARRNCVLIQEMYQKIHMEVLMSVEKIREMISELPANELFCTYRHVLTCMKNRTLIRGGNNPVSDYAEALFCEAFGWNLKRPSTQGYDAMDKEQVRYQVKARTLLHRSGSRQLGALRGLSSAESSFDKLAGVLFDDEFKVLRAALVPLEVVRDRSKFQEHTNSWIFHLADSVWDEQGVEDVTDVIRAATARLGSANN